MYGADWVRPLQSWGGQSFSRSPLIVGPDMSAPSDGEHHGAHHYELHDSCQACGVTFHKDPQALTSLPMPTTQAALSIEIDDCALIINDAKHTPLQ